MVNEFTLGVIGLDTSHTVAFTTLMQGEAPAGKEIKGLRVTKAMRFPSVFQTEEGQDERQKQLEEMGVEVGRSLEDTVQDVDGILIEVNDPALHLEIFEKVADLGKPVFLDKPLAGNLEDGKKIVALAKQKNVKVWSSSSLRFLTQLVAAKEVVSAPLTCNVFGALGKAAAGSDLIWYGVHANEMLVALMGTGAKTVFARNDNLGVVEIVEYANNRRAVVECNRGFGNYGGSVADAEKVQNFTKGDDLLYYNLLVHIRDFFLNGASPVPLEETLEVQAIMEAAEQSLKSGRAEPVLS